MQARDLFASIAPAGIEMVTLNRVEHGVCDASIAPAGIEIRRHARGRAASDRASIAPAGIEIAVQQCLR